MRTVTSVWVIILTAVVFVTRLAAQHPVCESDNELQWNKFQSKLSNLAGDQTLKTSVGQCDTMTSWFFHVGNCAASAHKNSLLTNEDVSVSCNSKRLGHYGIRDYSTQSLWKLLCHPATSKSSATASLTRINFWPCSSCSPDCFGSIVWIFLQKNKIQLLDLVLAKNAWCEPWNRKTVNRIEAHRAQWLIWTLNTFKPHGRGGISSGISLILYIFTSYLISNTAALKQKRATVELSISFLTWWD